MKAIAVTPGTQDVRLVERPEPAIRAPGEVKLKVVRVGICGTDRDEAGGGRALAPAGSRDLVMGHEMLGQVVESGSAVEGLSPGDFAVFTVRRGCGQCLPCTMNRPDMCRTGKYRERGIWGLDGYQCEYVVDDQMYLVKVPAEIGAAGVLTEPMSVAVKAVEEAVALQVARLPDAPATPNWLHGRRCLIAGLGPIGLLAAVALRLREAEVYGLDVVDAVSARPQWLTAIGGHYIDGRQVGPGQMEAKYGGFDLIFEATGIAALEFELMEALALNGAYVLTGIPMGDRPISVAGAELMRRMVLRNQVMLGSVNAARDHYQTAVDFLQRARFLWSGQVEKLITNCHPYSDFADAFAHHEAGEIKAVVEWS